MKSTITTILIIIIGTLMYSFLSKNGEKKDMNEWKQKIENQPGVVIDVRTQNEHDSGHLAATDLHYDFNSGEFERKVDQLDSEKTYYLYCRSGNRSGQAADIMKKKGFENVYNIGGFEDLANEGFETK